jgi:hypothetical protein
MKVLLDECVTRKLRHDLQGHDVHTIEEAGMKGLKNGELLRSASGQYEVLVTVDQNLQYQQNIKTLKLGIIVLVAKRNSYEALHPLMGKAIEALKQIKAGEVVIINAT